MALDVTETNLLSALRSVFISLWKKKKKQQKAFSRVVCALCVSFLLTFTLFLPSANSQPLFLLRFHFCSIALQIFHLPRAHLFVWMTNLLFPVEI